MLTDLTHRQGMPATVKLTRGQRTALTSIAEHGGITRSIFGDWMFRASGTNSFDVPKAAHVKALIAKDVLRAGGNGRTTVHDEFTITESGMALIR